MIKTGVGDMRKTIGLAVTVGAAACLFVCPQAHAGAIEDAIEGLASPSEEKLEDSVRQLAALDDPRAIPALQQAIARKGTQGRYANKPINGCLVDDAKAAVGYLQGLKKSEPKAP